MKVKVGRVDTVSMHECTMGFMQRVKFVVDDDTPLLIAEKVHGYGVDRDEARGAEIIVKITYPGRTRRELQQFAKAHQDLLLEVAASSHQTDDVGILGEKVVETDPGSRARLINAFETWFTYEPSA